MNRKTIYLDYNATAPMCPEARRAMAPFLDEEFGNPSSVHRPGARARRAVEEARRTVAAALGAQANEILFTSGGTESNNLVAFGAGDTPAAHLVVAPIEHSSVLGPVRECARRGAQVTWLPVSPSGHIDPADVDAALRPQTGLVSVGWANNEIGSIQPIESIAEVCRRRRVWLHVDAVQAFGKISIDVRRVDSCALSAHKMGGPKGAGALFLRRGRRLRPLLFGGEQERGYRPGTENVAALVGFGAAVEVNAPLGSDVTALRERLWRGVASPGVARRNSPESECLPNTLNVTFAGVTGEALVAALDLEGIAVSVGSACAAGSAEPSHVLRAIGRDERDAAGGVRFSLGPRTTAQEIDAAVEAVTRVIGRMRKGGAAAARAAGGRDG